MVSELIWGMVVAAVALASVLVVLPVLERWCGPPADPLVRSPRSTPSARRTRMRVVG